MWHSSVRSQQCDGARKCREHKSFCSGKCKYLHPRTVAVVYKWCLCARVRAHFQAQVTGASHRRKQQIHRSWIYTLLQDIFTLKHSTQNEPLIALHITHCIRYAVIRNPQQNVKTRILKKRKTFTNVKKKCTPPPRLYS